MTSSLVGSEMCIRDRSASKQHLPARTKGTLAKVRGQARLGRCQGTQEAVSYTHLTLPTICSV
eukprot:10257675-Prorocentrum_lima.AAC.1